MKLKETVFFAASLAILMASCSDETPWDKAGSNGEGSIKLHLSSSVDLESEMPQVRSVSSEIVPPPASDFQIRMTNTDGSYVKSWNSLEEFEKETDFRADTYTIEAFYGTPSSQGIVKEDEKGHEHAYFYGISGEIKVEPGKSTDVQIHTMLGNAVVIIEYSESFQNYFTDWSTQLITQGETPLDLGNNEGMAYVVPGDVDVVISATQQNGKNVTVNPAIFKAEAQHLYKIKYNIYNGEVGQADTLQVIFNDQPDAEHTIEIDLTDELLSGEGPKITTEGFQPDETLETVAGSPLDGIVKFNIDSPDGYKEVLLTIKVEGQDYEFLENSVVELCSADAEKQAQLSAAGIRVLGLFNNTDRLASVDLTEFCRYLPEGLHEFHIVVKDRARVSDSGVKLQAYPISVGMAPYLPAVLGRGYADVVLSYNGTDPTSGANPFSFNVKSDKGYEPSSVLSITQAPLSRAIENKDYVYRISVPETMEDSYEVRVFLNESSTPIDETTVSVSFPDYEMDYDPMAKRVMMRLSKVNDPEIDTEKVKTWFTQRLRVYIDGAENSNIIKSGDLTVTAKGLQGGSSFRVKTSLQSVETAEIFSSEETLNYEVVADVPNGDFEDLHETYSMQLNQGGPWSTSRLDGSNYQNTSTFTVQEPSEWSSSNIKTLNVGNPNSWFCQPSVFNSTISYTGRCPGVGIGTGGQSGTPKSYSGFLVHKGSNSMVIRNVAWDPNGVTPAKDSQGSNITGVKGTSEYYNTNIPEVAYKSAGKLFLGEYPEIEDIENSNGVEFSSRPMKLTGWYTYDSASDFGRIFVMVMENDKILAQGSSDLSQASEMTPFSVDLDNYTFKSKVTNIKILITSSQYASPSMEYETQNITVSDFSSKIESYKHGATLVVDDLKFDYE